METVAILELSRNLHYLLWIICRWFKAISITITNKRKEKPKKQTLIDQTYWLVRWRFISATSVIRVIGPLCNYAKGLPIINSKEATTNSIHIHELSLLFSYQKTAKMKIGKNKDAIGSRPVWGVTFRPTCFPIRLLAVPGFRISDRTRLRPFSYSSSIPQLFQ